MFCWSGRVCLPFRVGAGLLPDVALQPKRAVALHCIPLARLLTWAARAPPRATLPQPRQPFCARARHPGVPPASMIGLKLLLARFRRRYPSSSGTPRPPPAALAGGWAPGGFCHLHTLSKKMRIHLRAQQAHLPLGRVRCGG